MPLRESTARQLSRYLQAATPATGGDKALEKTTDVYKSFDENIDKLYKACSKVVSGETDTQRQNRLKTNMITGAVTSAVTATLGAGIAKTVLDVKYENIQDEAAKKWLEEVGSHIQCVIGTSEAGSFGSTVAIDYEE